MKVKALARVGILTVALLSATMATRSIAQDADAPAPKESEAAARKDTTESKTQANKTSGKKKTKDRETGKDIFRPSEEISEDFAVPFPVDI